MNTASPAWPERPAPESPAPRVDAKPTRTPKAPTAGAERNQAAKTRPGLPRRYRLRVLGRIVLAAVGGYAVAAALAAGLSLWLPALGWMPRFDATLFATMLGFLVHAVLAIAVFSCRSDRKALALVLIPAVVLGLALGLSWPGVTP